MTENSSEVTFYQKKIEICRKFRTMGEHLEPEENEIGGPVLVAVGILTMIVVIIYFWSK